MKKILNNIKYLTITIFTVGVLSVSSCSEWLNVQPSNQTSADELFKTEAGFQEALSGSLIKNAIILNSDGCIFYFSIFAQGLHK